MQARLRVAAVAVAGMLAACGDAAPVPPPGPAIGPRPATQTCLPGAPADLPERLSATGCFEALSPLTPGPDLVPYGVRSPLWSDGTSKQRFLVVPPGEKVTIRDEGSWDFPLGSVLVKVFAADTGGGATRVLETRFLVRRGTGWDFHAYRWNDAGTDATLVAEGGSEDVEMVWRGELVTVPYYFPGPSDCGACHSEAAGLILGPRTEQLNGTFDYGPVRANQLEALAAADLFAAPLAAAEELPSLPDPADPDAPIAARARSWLHANCAHCHRPGGWAPPDLGMDLRYALPLADTATCDVPTLYLNPPGTSETRLVPGSAETSAIWQRMTLGDLGQMPPIGASVWDPVGAEVVREWIDGMAGCP